MTPAHVAVLAAALAMATAAAAPAAAVPPGARASVAVEHASIRLSHDVVYMLTGLLLTVDFPGGIELRRATNSSAGLVRLLCGVELVESFPADPRPTFLPAHLIALSPVRDQVADTSVAGVFEVPRCDMPAAPGGGRGRPPDCGAPRPRAVQESRSRQVPGLPPHQLHASRRRGAQGVAARGAALSFAAPRRVRPALRATEGADLEAAGLLRRPCHRTGATRRARARPSAARTSRCATADRRAHRSWPQPAGTVRGHRPLARPAPGALGRCAQPVRSRAGARHRAKVRVACHAWAAVRRRSHCRPLVSLNCTRPGNGTAEGRDSPADDETPAIALLQLVHAQPRRSFPELDALVNGTRAAPGEDAVDLMRDPTGRRARGYEPSAAGGPSASEPAIVNSGGYELRSVWTPRAHSPTRARRHGAL